MFSRTDLIALGVLFMLWLIDKILGGVLIYYIMMIFDLDGYTSLWDKYHDPYRIRLRHERHWAVAVYKECKQIAIQNRDWCQVIALKRARSDYIWLYNIECDILELPWEIRDGQVREIIY